MMENNRKKCAVTKHCTSEGCFYQVEIINEGNELKIIPLNNKKYKTLYDVEEDIGNEYQVIDYDDLVCNLLRLRKDRMRAGQDE